ncbi:serine hydrolase domain-containing protein [Flavilitoribacter nigricans]|uniref:Serine hydrolase n=1 Tax=Flavilitoribacter nigricans (strain ATCC 23147 / DSM 23189 / NBRC 102662 / NCIMB 1420 / SS-2) TaxID=1122177 RepID=A0A2D0NEW4_FLAN2|nr:serine hydrolase domain-containing protein [Flavilitoribacter nigricans]PHN07051.1 serine hydrolase [Flavilitoribacter nigricans DSM 23189 = NBRC 102662]
MRISRSIGFFTVFSVVILFAYDWIGSGSILAKDSTRMPVSSFPVPTTEPALQRTLDGFISELRQAMAVESIPGISLAVVYNGQEVLHTGYGITDLDNPFLVNDQTVFRLASLSKGFAPVLVGMLVDEGILDWDDPIVKYLPDFRLKSRTATNALTIRNVLSHATGLPRHAYSNLLNMSVPYREIVPRLAKVNLPHRPGEIYNYQNVAYSLIGDVVEKATGISYDSLLTSRIFQPLEMQHASVGFAKMSATPRAAQPHARKSSGYYRLDFRDKWYDVEPAAGVNASSSDLSKWLQLMMGEHPDLLSPQSLEEITKKQIGVSPREGVMRSWSPMEDSGYGLGWRNLVKDGHRIVFHGGFVNGYRAEIGFCPESRIGIVLLSNGSNQFLRDALPRFFERFFNQRIAS